MSEAIHDPTDPIQVMKIPPKAQKAAKDAAEKEARVRAARQAAKVEHEAAPPEIVTCRVLKNGDGKISMGQHAAGIGEVHYEKGEEFRVTREIGEALETRGFVEIQEP